MAESWLLSSGTHHSPLGRESKMFDFVYQNEAYSKLSESSMAGRPAQIAWIVTGSPK